MSNSSRLIYRFRTLFDRLCNYDMNAYSMHNDAHVLYDVRCNSRRPCRNNDTTERRANRRTSLSARRPNVANSTVIDVESDRATFVNTTSSQPQTVEVRRHGNATRPKHRLIRGSKQAATITKKELLKTDWCQTEPFQQIVHEVGVSTF